MRRIVVFSLALLLLATASFAREGEKPADGAPPPGPPASSGPLTFVKLEGGAVHQVATDLEKDGDFGVSRFFVQPGLDVFFSRELQTSFALGYGLDRYDFDGRKGLAALEPWEDVDSLRLSALARYSLDEAWTLFGVPVLSFAAERGARLTDGTTVGFYGGASWKSTDGLTIGPGFGVFTEIEDSAVFFPFLLIDWQISERLAVRTGRGLAATRGPGLVLAWEFADRWAIEAGGRWEQLRFRLDDDGAAPDGVGEEESIPLFAALTYELAERSRVSLLGGVNLYGSVSLFDDRGRKLRIDLESVE